jgi:hypothetical protein
LICTPRPFTCELNRSDKVASIGWPFTRRQMPILPP